ncbi:hypothetical protein BC827DRAFT_1211761 [Russula dissimulans]|nr:hypothetical protein BC827DRAFT_1211761 [Russula dissimulans]
MTEPDWSPSSTIIPSGLISMALWQACAHKCASRARARINVRKIEEPRLCWSIVGSWKVRLSFK